MDRLQFSNSFAFLNELGEALSTYFSEEKYSNHVSYFKYANIEIYDWRLAAMRVRCYFAQREERILILARKNVALDRDCRIFNQNSMKEIIDTDFYAQLIEIPAEHQPPSRFRDNADLTEGMKNFLLESFEPKPVTTLSESLEQNQKWLRTKFRTRTIFEITP